MPQSKAPDFSGRKVVLYYAAWCGHCQHFKPSWDQQIVPFMRSKKIPFLEVDDVLNNRLRDTHMYVGAFPTIAIVENRSIVSTYAGDRTPDKVMKFIELSMKRVKTSGESGSGGGSLKIGPIGAKGAAAKKCVGGVCR